jgi:hypothetical protein
MNQVLFWVDWSYHAAHAAQQKYELSCEIVQKFLSQFCDAEFFRSDITGA